MLISEFIDRTGYLPTAVEYAEIEQAYYVFDGDKDAFCRAWSKANPHKAGSYTAKVKEQERLSNVFDKLVAHIIKYAKRRDFDRDMFYHMDYSEQQMHADFVCRTIKAKDRRELRAMMQQLCNATAVKQGWSSKTWEYYYSLERIV